MKKEMKKEMRLIDANALLENLGEEPMVWSDGEAEIQERNDWQSFKACVEAQDTVDAVEVVHGEWEKYTDDRFMGYGADGRIRYRKVYSYKCSKCWNYTAVKHKYCPNCGADMRERKDNDG